jgi:5-methylcytosine-specific restriction endonuclease McrA
MAKSRADVHYYGAVALIRMDCPSCKERCLVIAGRHACCNRKVRKIPRDERIGLKVEFEASNIRSKPSKHRQEALLIEQENRCIYCGRLFGSNYERNGKLRMLKINWDHFVPFAYVTSNPAENFLAACHLCNGLKGSKMFKTFKETREYVESRKRSKKIQYRDDDVKMPRMQESNLYAEEKQNLLLPILQMESVGPEAPET